MLAANIICPSRSLWSFPKVAVDKNYGTKRFCKTAFTCYRGLYKYSVMPFDLANAPGIFQELMSIVLHGLRNFAMAYLDGIIICSASEEEHKQHIQNIFDSLMQSNIKLKLSKCKFMQIETQYLGFIMSEDGIMADSQQCEGNETNATTYMYKKR